MEVAAAFEELGSVLCVVMGAATPGAHAAKLAAFRAGVGGAAPAPATAEQRPRAVPLETPRGTALVAEDGTPLAAVHGSQRQVAATHKKERKRTGKKVKKAA